MYRKQWQQREIDRSLWRRPCATIVFLVIADAVLASVVAAEAVQVEKLYDQAKRASVEIIIDDRHRGSGWFVDSQGLLFTAAHVVGKGEGHIEVFQPKLGRLPAEVIVRDPGHDLALLRLKDNSKIHPAIKLADESPRIGEQLYLLGAPLFRRHILLGGRVARTDIGFEFYRDQRCYVGCYYVASPSPQGSSGGIWLNENGNAVGVQSGAMSLGQALQGLAFVSPLPAMKRLLRSQTSPSTPTLGVAIEETWQQSAKYLAQLPSQTDGLVVKRLIENGPSARAGIKQMEVITAVEGKRVRLPEELLRVVRQKTPGDVLRLRVVEPQTHKQRSVAVKLDALN